MTDSIFALSSGRLPAAIAVVRVSGPRAGDALLALAGRMAAPRQAMLARLRDPDDGEALDDALVLWFPAPRSETGEDIAEFQLHGGRAIVASVLRVLGEMSGLRPAEAGEFARRAFANGKLDLTRVEALADLIGAETEAQRRQAFRQLRGLLGDRAEEWRARLIEAMALVEALIDFPDEAVPADLLTPALAIAEELLGEIRGLLADDRRGERLRDGLRVAVTGPVNVGKSSIVNLMAKRPAAIVSPYAGTTRDVIEVHLDLVGFPVTVLDTAGLRDSDDPVEQEGVRRAREQAANADLVLWVVDARDPAPPAPPPLAPDRHQPTVWVVANKCDLLGPQREFGDAERPTRWLRETDRTRRSANSNESHPDQPHPEERANARVSKDGGWPGLRPGPGLAALPSFETARAPAGHRASSGRGLEEAGAVSSYGPAHPVDETMPAHPADSNGENAVRFAEENIAGEKKPGVDRAFGPCGIRYRMSALTGASFEALLAGISAFAAQYFGSQESPLITRERHRSALVACTESLARAITEGSSGREEIVAEELRLAATALGRLTGRVDVEDVLDVIFREFCIGK